MAHLKQLEQHFGAERVLGGLCFIESTLDGKGHIVQTSPSHHLLFGPLPGTRTDRLEELKQYLTGTAAPINYSDTITRDMWNKYLFITTFSGVTSLFRSSIGPIRSQEQGMRMIRRLATEAKAAMERQGAIFIENIEQIQEKQILQMNETMKSSLQRDIEKGNDVESEHLFGKLLMTSDIKRYPLLLSVYLNLQIYRSIRS